MPGLTAQRSGSNNSYLENESRNGTTVMSQTVLSWSNGSSNGGNGFWSKNRDDVSYNQLQKFWSDLSLQSRQKLLRIDKQTLFEQARKNMYCSRCNGLLLEGFLQIVMYGKSLQQEGPGGQNPCSKRLGALKSQNVGDSCMKNGSLDDIQDPSVHPWGGLTTTRDGMLTLMDCYLCSKSLKSLQNVFDSARARERERELLYPDACGGGGRGWISQGMASYGRAHGPRETCALHTARLSVDTLVDFWSALGEETRLSLLRMKEEDFIERLMYRFDSKRFCRDCRRNVIREFKELKELKRMRREPRCTNWFCVADTAFNYEVSHDTVQADWHQTFVDTFGTYHHFEWAVGTGEGKSDILDFENVGLSGRVQVSGLDLSGLNACYITLRAWKMDGRCTELSVKAHALKGQQCVHCRLIVGDGFVTITRGESIRRFFEHAEEAEEEEDDDSMDKDGNELDGECSRPQKHAKSPELAREFLLDAATVIFKEQVEKAFREGTARQNAHSIFVCLALKLLEERVHIACKEIITLEKQMKLLEEEEKEKREEEERKERRRTKEREKKLRRKERLREKEKDKDRECFEVNKHPSVPDVSNEDGPPNDDDEESGVIISMDSVSETGEAISSTPLSPDIQDDNLLDGYFNSDSQNCSDDGPDGDLSNTKDGNGLFPIDHPKYSQRNFRNSQQDMNLKWADRRRFAVVSESGGVVSKYEARHYGDTVESSRSNGLSKHSRNIAAKSISRNGASKFGDKFNCSINRTSDRYDSHACSCNQQHDFRSKVEPHMPRVIREAKSVNKSESVSDISKPYYRGSKYNQLDYVRENCGRPKSKTGGGNNSSNRDSHNAKKVWEPMESQKKYPRSNSDSDFSLRSVLKAEGTESDQSPQPSDAHHSDEVTDTSVEQVQDLKISCPGAKEINQDRFYPEVQPQQYSKEVPADEEGELSRSSQQVSSDSTGSSSSDNCSSCLSEGDSNTSSSNLQNSESSSSSDSEDASQNSEGRESSPRLQNGASRCREITEKRQILNGGDSMKTQIPDCAGTNFVVNLPGKAVNNCDNGNITIGAQPQGVLPPLQNQGMHFPMFQPPAMGYYHQSPMSWPTAPTNGMMSFPHPNHYVFASPFGYGLNGNTRFMPYGGLHHMTPPLLNPSHLPVFQPVAQTNGINLKEHIKISNPGGMKEPQQEPVHKIVPNGQHPTEARTTGEGGKLDKSDRENTGFSLFHFGGPVALSTGFQTDPVSLKEGFTGNLPPNSSVDHGEGNAGGDKKGSVEEYNLFANGIKFSLF